MGLWLRRPPAIRPPRRSLHNLSGALTFGGAPCGSPLPGTLDRAPPVAGAGAVVDRCGPVRVPSVNAFLVRMEITLVYNSSTISPCAAHFRFHVEERPPPRAHGHDGRRDPHDRTVPDRPASAARSSSGNGMRTCTMTVVSVVTLHNDFGP